MLDFILDIYIGLLPEWLTERIVNILFATIGKKVNNKYFRAIIYTFIIILVTVICIGLAIGILFLIAWGISKLWF